MCIFKVAAMTKLSQILHHQFNQQIKQQQKRKRISQQ